jgi:diguanylate cyclase (GGDEF)-like protein
MKFNRPAYDAIMRLIKSDGGESGDLQKAFEEMVGNDPLTGVYNRMAITERLASELRATMRGRPLSVGMVDIDFFKRINDEHGHQRGDEVLVNLARFLAQHVRGPGIVGRYGGEEFQLVMPSTRLPNAYKVLERLREKTGEEVGVTISGGVASDAATGVRLALGKSGRDVISAYCEKDGNFERVKDRLEQYAGISRRDPRKVRIMMENAHSFLVKFPGHYDLLQREPELFASYLITDYADRALYLSKKNGRNRVYAHGEGGFGTYTKEGSWAPL